MQRRELQNEPIHRQHIGNNVSNPTELHTIKRKCGTGIIFHLVLKRAPDVVDRVEAGAGIKPGARFNQHDQLGRSNWETELCTSTARSLVGGDR